MSGSVDLWQSRRANFEKCEWWKRDNEATKDLSKFVLSKKRQGYFYATEANSQSFKNSQYGGVFMSRETNITLKTNDDVDEIQEGDIVRYSNALWRVTDVQVSEIHKQKQFLDEVSKVTYIGIKR